MWTFGNTCLVRIGDRVFASGTETLAGVPPLNNVRWVLYERQTNGWKEHAKGFGRTREPCPLACFSDKRLLLSDNPTLTGPEARDGPARPEIVEWNTRASTFTGQILRPEWAGEPPFTEHSYRSFAADGSNRELILFHNVGYTHAEWTFCDRTNRWSAQGRLDWPWGGEYPTPRPIRVCYPSVALRDRKVYFLGVSDIPEPYPEWQAYKKTLTGKEWDYDFRRLFFSWSDDIATGKFHDWIEVASRDKTCGWIRPCDLAVGADGAVHLLWQERAIDLRLREKFFPDETQSVTLNYGLFRDGQVRARQVLHRSEDRLNEETVQWGRLHQTPDGRFLVIYTTTGTEWKGHAVEILPDGSPGPAIQFDLKNRFVHFYTATTHAGCEPSWLIDLYGVCAGQDNRMCYSCLRVDR